MSNETLPDLLPDVHVNNLTAINVNISGTLTSNTFISISQIETDDTLIKLANNNTDDIMDVGWYAKYISAGTKYRGNVFDVSAGRFIFFTTNTEPTTTVSSISYSDVQLKDLYAVNLTGTLTTTSQPNITSVGTLTGLTLAGNLDMNGFNLLNLGSFVIDQLDATITRAAQPNITSVGTLTGLTLAGNLDMGGFNLLNLGSFSVDQLDATITRAAQPNITSVGTLLGLSVNGVLNMSTNNITNIATLTAANLGGTLTTAAQSNITSVGTLTGLTMAGNLNMGTHDITNIATVTATNIGGTLTTATQSNITSVGTLTGLTMAGNLNMGTHDITNVATVTATNLGGTLTTAAQSNITSVGSLSGLTMAGNLNMNTHDIVNATTVTATNISGTLTTASQSNITSVGILLGLTVTGTSLFDNGTDVVPSIAFTSDTNTGLYKIGADQIGITTNGTLNFSFGSSQNETKQIILFPNGSVSAPTFAFSVSNTTGIYSSGSNVIDFTTGSAQRLSLSSTVMTVTNDDISGNQFQIIGRTLATKKIMLGYNTTSNFGKIEVTASTPLHIEASSLNPNTTNTIGLGTASLKWSDSYINKIYIADGSAVAPGLTFSSDTNTGLYSSAADQLSVSIGGTHAYTFGAVNISANQIQAPVGSTGSASYAFAGDPNTGIFSSTADTINFTAGGIDALQISTSAISTSLPFTFNGNLFANAYYFTGDPDTSITNPADDNNIIFTTGGGTRFVIGSADITSNLKFLLPNGSIGSPSLAFATGSNTGFYYDNAIPYLGLQFAGIDLMYFDASRVDIIASLNVITGICAAPQFLFYAEPTTGFVNPTTDTLAFMTNSINRLTINTAVITTTLPIVGPNGAATAPSYSFSGDPNTGMYSGGADVLAFSTGGTSRLQITTANLTSTIPIIVPVGSAVAPSYSFSGDPNTGVFSSAADTIDFSTGGTSRMQITTTGVIFDVAVTFNSGFAIGAGSAAVPAYAFSTDPNTGMYSGGADVLAFSTGGVLRMQIDTANLTSVLPIIAPVGSAAAPSYSFSGDLDTGVYSAGANTLNFSTGGTSRMQISTTAITSTLPVTVPDGNTAAPGIRFTSEATGFSVPAAGTLAFSIAGSSQVNITTARVATSIPILGQNGSTSAPVYSFTNSTNTGIYLDSVGILGISAGGVSSTIFSATQALFLAGSVGSPGLSFASDTNTGIYSAGADAIAVTTGGTARFVLNTATADLTLPLRLTGNSKYTTINTTDNTFKDTNAGSVINQSLQIADYVGTGYGFVGMNFDALDTNSSLNFNLLNASSQIIRGAAVVGNVSTVRTAGSETGNLYFYIKPSASAIAEVLRMVASGSNLQMQSVNGTASVPSYSFVNSTGSGLYYTGTTNTIAIATGGTARLTLNTTSVTSSLPFYAPDGTAAAPSHTFTNDTDTGIYSYGVNSIGISAGGTWRQVVDSNGIYGSVPFLGVLGSISAPAFTFVSDTNTGMYSSAADTLDFTTGGTNRLSLSTTTATSTIKHSITNAETATNSLYLNSSNASYASTALYANFVRAATASYNVLNAVANSVTIATLSGLGYWFVSDGTAAAPSYSFVNDPNTGMFSSAADTIGFATGGTSRLTLSTTALTSTLPVVIPVGSAASPSMTFASDLNNGIYSSATDNVDVATAGVRRLNVDSAGNVAIGASPSFGSGAVVLFLANATTAPTANPTGGGILYVESGALKFRGSSGTITTIAQA